MTDNELRSAFPPMPTACADALQAALRALPDSPRRTRPLRRIPALALAMLLLAALACAAAREPILSWLLGASPSSGELSALVQPIGHTARITIGDSNDLSLSLCDLVCDGEQLSFAYQVENHKPKRPVAVALHRVTIGGQDAHILHATASAEQPLWIPSFHLDALPAQRNPAVGGATVSLAAPLTDEPLLIEAEFALLRPSAPLAVVDSELLAPSDGCDEPFLAELQDVRDTLRSFDGLAVAGPDAQDAADWLARGYIPIDMRGNPLAGAQLDEVCTFAVRFSARPMFALHDFAPDAPIPLEDCTADVRRLTLSPLSTRLTLALIPRENTREAAERLAQAYGEMTLCDEDGAPLAFMDMDWCASLLGTACEQGGQWLCLYDFTLPGPARMPDALRLRAGNGFELALPEHLP